MVDHGPAALAWAAYHVVVEMRSWRVGRPLFSERHGDDGDGAPAVVFLHGLTASGRSWRRVAASLDDAGLHLHLVDLLGFGRLPWPRVAYTTDDHLAALTAWRMDAGRAGVPIILVGHSLGALLALAAARRDPTVAGVVLMVPLGSAEVLESCSFRTLGSIAFLPLSRPGVVKSVENARIYAPHLKAFRQ